MSSNPYENEPGFETAKKDEPMPSAYIAKIRHETLRVSVIQRLETLLQLQPDKLEPAHKKLKSESSSSTTLDSSKSPSSEGSATPASVYEYDAEATFNALEQTQWNPFSDVTKRRFLWYYDSYIRAIDTFAKEQKDGTAFQRCEFEYGSNAMEGQFTYDNLKSRMQAILGRLNEEAASWEQQGAEQVAKGTQLATQLAFQFKQLQYKWNECHYSGPRLEISLANPKNPFVWQLTMFGEPSTNLDGGIFSMILRIPPDFPTAQPRLTVQTPIFHIRVSSNSTLCYFPKKEEEISSHLEAIVAALRDENANFDPRANVHPEAFALYFGGEDKRKIYNRKLRRSAQESSEFL